MPITAARAFSLRNMELWMDGGETAEGMDRIFRMYEKVWFVSIVDYGHKRIMIPGDDTICFSFDDIDMDEVDDFGDPAWKNFEFEEGPLFSAPEARRMVAFLEKAHTDPRNGILAVHCHGGVSRSGGVAEFCKEAYGLSHDMFEMMNPYISPNLFVKRLLHEARAKLTTTTE
jgi:predicted protein tyrosine phosphatase